MGEAACLLRSFSHPSENSLQAEQGDPIRVLGESISFGRFMSESLAWEKWSSFSQNRYLEEVEKFSKPGSVAQKKAYFEAHYKKKALQREANFVEETNPQSAIVTPAQTEEKSSPSEFTSENSGDIVDNDTTLEIIVSDVELLSSIDANVGDSPVDRSLEEISESKEEEEEDAAILETKNTEDNEAAMELSKGLKEILESGGEERRLPSKKRFAVSSLKLGPQIGAASKLSPNPAKKANLRPRTMSNPLSKSMKPTDNVLEKSRLTATAKSLHSTINFPSGLRKPNEKRLAVSTLKLGPQIGAASKLPPNPAIKANLRPRQMSNPLSKSMKPTDNVLEKSRLTATAKSLHSSINLPSGSRKSNERRLAVSSHKSRPQIGASKLPPDPTAEKPVSLLPRQMSNAFSKSSKPADNVLEKARLTATAKSLHASINFPSGLTKSNKATAYSQSAARIVLLKDVPKPQKTPLKASEDWISKKSPVKTRPNDRRILSQSVSALDVKLKSSARFSTANGNRLRPPTVSSSFNFRIEERALKRKEFFQKLEEKAMEKKELLQTRYKNETAPGNKKRWQSTSGMAKPCENRQRRTPFPSNHVGKVAKEPVKGHVSYSLPPRRLTAKSDRPERLAGKNKTAGIKSSNRFRVKL